MGQYDPYEHAERLGIRVEYQSLRTVNGLWIPDRNLIIIRSGMRRPHERSTLAHEIGHAIHGHRDDRPKHERQADVFAATHLIDPETVRGLLEWTPDVFRLAAELDVSPRMVRVFLDHQRLCA